MQKLFINPQSRLCGLTPNCAHTSVSANKLGNGEFGKDTLVSIAKTVKFRVGVL